jgi:ferredoxin
VPYDEIELPAANRIALEGAAEADGLPLSAMLKDETRCIRCGLCAIRCPTDAMTMERFSITERYAPLPKGGSAAPAGELSFRSS